MAEALRLLVGGSAQVYAVTFGLSCLVLQVFLPYETCVRWLKWLTLDLLSYVAVAFTLFWQAAQEMEDACGRPPQTPPDVHRHLRRIKADTIIGMGFSNLIAFFIILSTAATLHAAGMTDIQTSAQAAEALRPLAGEFTFLLFGLGIIGTGMLAVTVLAMLVTL